MSAPYPASVLVIGLGTMGRGIVRALRGTVTDLRSFDEAPVTDEPGARRYNDLADAARGVDIIIEAIVEDLSAKRTLLRYLEGIVPEAIIASTTSTFLPSGLATSPAQRRRLLLAHFFNPADVVPLVEVVPAESTDRDAVETVIRMLRATGKSVVRLQREVDGLVANRLQAALIREAMHLRARGVASAEDIDRVLTTGLGPRWSAAGCFEVMDQGGLDVWARVLRRLVPDLASGHECADEVDELVLRGQLGVKSGRGFASHDSDAAERYRHAVEGAFGARRDDS
ncbi:3-hydroxyacyl-CoA dehydrogenase family protein [Salinibacterium soli]|uniref:L-gulonate 3-dehydrogenase n=1 Tax=Antiquaquibacter soli TaxID=3064523 RepID=A0ABT9BNV9_9MICO|nr:3-hydroxyacyl-CoA dehydrogenase family protein [Protaetiibacter sp. WY-16]MDO7882711.1 3-hydroxyacyl-CoA dehydrogenase family protein [Protaetiibacter sp. WY-16]